MAIRKTKPDETATSAQQQAYLFLRDQIQVGRLAGGSRIKPEDIAIELGISRMPVREAIRQLDTEGLLTIRPNRGAIVTVFSADHLSELFEMRAVLEGLCARRAAVDFDEDAADELMLLLNRLNRAAGNINLWIERHEAFHDFICERADRPHVLAEVRKLRAAVEPYLRLSQTHPVTMGDSGRQHKELIDVLSTRDPDRAEAVNATPYRQHRSGIHPGPEPSPGAERAHSLKAKRIAPLRVTIRPAVAPARWPDSKVRSVSA